jgi:[ribosomal protein S18]-alanine N-acetyltransferase
MLAKGHPEGSRSVFRLCRREDLPSVVAILAEVPEASRWSIRAAEEIWRQGSVIALVGERAGQVTGFVFGRRVADEGEILNLAVRTGYRRRREGRNLVGALLEEFVAQGVRRVFLEVRESNLGARAFYEYLGFRKVGRREAYYREPDEPALILERRS